MDEAQKEFLKQQRTMARFGQINLIRADNGFIIQAPFVIFPKTSPELEICPTIIDLLESVRCWAIQELIQIKENDNPLSE